MKLIIGLGNPGKEYEKTRHNTGFMCVETLREKLNFPKFLSQKKFSALVTEGIYEGEKLILAKPETFMNLSGQAVSALVNFYKCNPQDLYVIFDDIDLKLGEIRVRKDGSAGTHNGMKSVIESLGFMNFPRLRIGIESRGVSSAKEQDISSFVLNGFSAEELELVKKAINNAIESLLLAMK